MEVQNFQTEVMLRGDGSPAKFTFRQVKDLRWVATARFLDSFMVLPVSESQASKDEARRAVCRIALPEVLAIPLRHQEASLPVSTIAATDDAAAANLLALALPPPSPQVYPAPTSFSGWQSSTDLVPVVAEPTPEPPPPLSFAVTAVAAAEPVDLSPLGCILPAGWVPTEAEADLSLEVWYRYLCNGSYARAIAGRDEVFRKTDLALRRDYKVDSDGDTEMEEGV